MVFSQCESGSGTFLGVLPGVSGRWSFASKSQGLTGTCVLCEGGEAARGGSEGVQRRDVCMLSMRPAVWWGDLHLCEVWMAPVHGG